MRFIIALKFQTHENIVCWLLRIDNVSLLTEHESSFLLITFRQDVSFSHRKTLMGLFYPLLCLSLCLAVWELCSVGKGTSEYLIRVTVTLVNCVNLLTLYLPRRHENVLSSTLVPLTVSWLFLFWSCSWKCLIT